MDPVGAHQEMLDWLAANPVVDKDKSNPVVRLNKPVVSRKSTARLDLHGKTQKQAAAALKRVLEECRDNGEKRLVIIHGQGWHSKIDEGPVLKKLVCEMLENECRSLIKTYRPAGPKEGGAGATIALL